MYVCEARDLELVSALVCEARAQSYISICRSYSSSVALIARKSDDYTLSRTRIWTSLSPPPACIAIRAAHIISELSDESKASNSIGRAPHSTLKSTVAAAATDDHRRGRGADASDAAHRAGGPQAEELCHPGRADAVLRAGRAAAAAEHGPSLRQLPLQPHVLQRAGLLLRLREVPLHRAAEVVRHRHGQLAHQAPGPVHDQVRPGVVESRQLPHHHRLLRHLFRSHGQYHASLQTDRSAQLRHLGVLHGDREDVRRAVPGGAALPRSRVAREPRARLRSGAAAPLHHLALGLLRAAAARLGALAISRDRRLPQRLSARQGASADPLAGAPARAGPAAALPERQCRGDSSLRRRLRRLPRRDEGGPRHALPASLSSQLPEDVSEEPSGLPAVQTALRVSLIRCAFKRDAI
ncbi:unnamed protein product [Trichogramma brassicae]|uniref:Uncharacterized protein n=1 Tax=Trichogramma brassicae TaxID=86971 RepID=A0A6H5I400_9HYME|nr:unnamed protein product [Trichogramma brassicae]